MGICFTPYFIWLNCELIEEQFVSRFDEDIPANPNNASDKRNEGRADHFMFKKLKRLIGFGFDTSMEKPTVFVYLM